MSKRLMSAFLLLFTPWVNGQTLSLPIWKEKAQAMGYVLPNPLGVSVNYMTLEQGIAVDRIGFSGSPLLTGVSHLFDFQAQGGTQSTEVMNIRADLWLLPFLNFYAMAGKITGHSKTTVVMTGKLTDSRTQFPFELNLDGDLYGGGMVLAGGYHNWFAIIDASYTKTHLTVIDGAIDAIVVSPRLGYDFNDMGTPLRVWLGGMYQDVAQFLAGDMQSIGISQLKSGRFQVEQHLATRWNPIFGAQYQFTPNWYLLGEFGFGERRSAFLSFDYRF